MGFGKGIRSNLSRAGSKREQAKRKTDSESFEEECKRQTEDISRLQSELNEALAQHDLAIQQRDEALAKTIPIMVRSSKVFVLFNCLIGSLTLILNAFMR